jgi:hypothetical protein
MTNEHRYKRAVLIAAHDIRKLRKTVHIQSAAIAVLSAAAALLAVTRTERKQDPT